MCVRREEERYTWACVSIGEVSEFALELSACIWVREFRDLNSEKSLFCVHCFFFLFWAKFVSDVSSEISARLECDRGDSGNSTFAFSLLFFATHKSCARENDEVSNF